MNIELISLLGVSLFVLVAWMPAFFGKAASYGMGWIFGNRELPEGARLLPWAGRAERAYRNLLDYYPAFPTIILALAFLGISTELTQNAAMAFFGFRVLHFLFYLVGWSLLRTATWFVSLVALFVLYCQGFQALLA